MTISQLKAREVDPAKLDLLRTRKANEREMAGVLREIFTYGVFLFFLLSLSAQNRNYDAFLMQDHFQGIYNPQGALEQVLTGHFLRAK